MLLNIIQFISVIQQTINKDSLGHQVLIVTMKKREA